MPQTEKQIRKPLSELQARKITETQQALAVARAEFANREAHAKSVIELIADAVGVSPEAVLSFDETTRELVLAAPADEPEKK